MTLIKPPKCPRNYSMTHSKRQPYTMNTHPPVS